MLSDFQSQGYMLLLIKLVESLQDLSFWSGYSKIHNVQLGPLIKKRYTYSERIFSREYLDYCWTDNLYDSFDFTCFKCPTINSNFEWTLLFCYITSKTMDLIAFWSYCVALCVTRRFVWSSSRYQCIWLLPHYICCLESL